mmetsp:Transcript_100150/g.279035  ORF Transcript_100150/g.279035 Transcript_100150/m.279035 type:complete len:166 (-) Transcript_100150:64-561(-)
MAARNTGSLLTLALLACATLACGLQGHAFLSPASPAASAGSAARLHGAASLQGAQAGSGPGAALPTVSVGALALSAAAAVRRRGARAARRAEAISKPAGTSQWVNEQSPGMSHPSGFYVLPYVPEKEAEGYDYERDANKKDTSRTQVGSGQPKWDITQNYVGKFN